MEGFGFEFIHSHVFDREWMRLGQEDEALRALQSQLMFNPECGDVIAGTGGLRKMRWAIRRGQGKSGGARVCYAVFRRHGILYLVLVFAKADQANIAPAKKAAIAMELKRMQKILEGGSS
jgi:hypothetical protein